MASRLEMGKGELPIYVVGCHFSHSSDAGGHKELWDRIEVLVQEYAEFGHVVLVGDFHSHTKANGDTTEDSAGRRMIKRTGKMNLQVVNHMPVCEGLYSRVLHLGDGSTLNTTIDYVCVSKELVGRVKNMKLGQQLGSDHKFVTLRLAGMEPKKEDRMGMREVWRTEKLPVTQEDTASFVNTYQKLMDNWIGQTKTLIHAMEAVATEATRIADIVEWSFQAVFDQGSDKELGTKLVGPKATPMLNSAMRMLNDHRKVCEVNLKRVAARCTSTSDDRAQAVRLYRESKQALFKATTRRKFELEQQTFRQIEEKQADSKLFWARTKRITGRMKTGIKPPPMVMNAEGKVESDPVEVLRTWRRFSAEMADTTPEEEGIYDDEYKEEVEARLDGLRRLNIYQEELDGIITDKEIFDAIRKMKMGKAPGVDGILPSILRHAADAVGTNKMKQGNSVVAALSLLFNYVFHNEVWPERWGSGIIFPLYKQDSRLEPENYRPITLLSVIGKLFGLVIDKRISDWSERNGVISDEQGGFRQARGTPDQIFLLREILSSRKERGLPTLVTYIDAKKAYDTVWREGNYVRLFDAGMQGKMWRQIQAMGGNMKSKVRLSVGETQWHDVKRGVAQGAVESPWLYSCFIDGMTDELKKRNLGVMVAGLRIPLLMYADDIVMIASSVTELREMNKVATEYAFKHRFRHNGEKSAVMTFNADKALRSRVSQERWELSGEKVEVKKEYKYLGVDILNETADWRTHVKRLIRKAEHRSLDLQWMCRRDKGLRPRSAATLWKAMVRPVLEYAAELWAGDIPKDLAAKAEQVQTDFARAILGLQGQRGVSNDFVRSEMGLEMLASRWEKLRLGYWRRIQVALPSRALSIVARMRRGQVRWGLGKVGELSWMQGTRTLLNNREMAQHWTDPKQSSATSKATWKKIVYRHVEEHFERQREQRVESLSSLDEYKKVKHWGPMDKDRAQFVGEIDRRGSLVVERYLDDVKDRLGTRLKLMWRAGCIPVLSRVMWELDLPADQGICMMCKSRQIETMDHLILSCPAYQKHRERMEMTVEAAYSLGNDGASLADTSDSEHTRMLMGARAGCSLTEDSIDMAVKRFLRKAWKTRRRLTHAINDEFGRQDIEWAKGNGWAKPIAKADKKKKRKDTTKSDGKSCKTAEKPVQYPVQVTNPKVIRKVARKLLFE